MKKRMGIRGAIAAAAALLLLSAGTVAHASDVTVTAVVDATAPNGAVILEPGESTEVTVNLAVTGNQVGTATFKVYTKWTLTAGGFVGSEPTQRTVSPQSGGTTSSYTVSAVVEVAEGVAPQAYILTVGVFDIVNSNQTGAKLAAGDKATYTVTVPEVAPPTDSTPPSIEPVLDPSAPDGSNDWYKSDVSLSWTVSDPDSSVTTTGCEPTIITVDQFATDYTCTATSAGGTASQTVTIKRDGTAPQIEWVGGPSEGAEYYFGSVPAEPTCEATDATSGIDGDGCVVSGYSAAVGPHELAATATDLAGNKAGQTVDYEVLAWTLKGFYQPVDLGTLNVVKSGSTVPLKFEVFAGETEFTDVSAIDTFKVGVIDCGSLTGVPTDDIEQYSTGATVLRYDTTGGQFIQNWQTPKGKAGSCYQVKLVTDDGSALTANFRLK
ncbi:PxKF domain-containing protein [Microbacterium hibisci]|uniref:PxKF domain-containing protein n=1 Tax=Microbacterium hibisci TaxID=2036000 RepID=UPI001941B19C|nr:PxKF domain-containing protein [Microbacterium hibisci]